MLTTSLVRRHHPPPSDVLTWEVGHVVLDGRTRVGWGSCVGGGCGAGDCFLFLSKIDTLMSTASSVCSDAMAK